MAGAVAIVIVCSLLVLLLSGVVLLARHWLMPGGHATITINGRRHLEATLGERLLWVLAEHDVLLPAACGGRGSCGQCHLKVTAGGGSILPVESALISRHDAAQGERLACMVTVQRDLSIAVPDTILEAKECVVSVASNVSITTFLKELTLQLPTGTEFDYEAGDYVLIDAPPGTSDFSTFEIAEPYHAAWTRQDLWRLSVTRRQHEVRAYSIANAPRPDGVLQLVVRIALPPPRAGRRVPPGQVSSYLFGLAAGSEVTIRGPFGGFHARDTAAEMVFIGGGAGIAPLRAMILDQLQTRASTRRISLWYGARDMHEICYADEFDALARKHENFSWCTALSDAHLPSTWKGHRGFIHAVLRDEFLSAHPAPEDVEYYLCGPPLMSGAVCTMLEDYGVPAENILFDDFGS